MSQVWSKSGNVWKRMGRPDRPSSSQAVGWIGDSLTAQTGAGNGPTGIKNALVTQGFSNDSRVDGLVGRSIVDGVAPYIPSSQSVIDTWRSQGFNPDTWVISLITNDEWDTDSGWNTKITTLLNKIAEVPKSYRVYWIGLSYRSDIRAQSPQSTRASRWLSVANTVAANRTDMTVIPIDYDALIHDGRDETGLWDSADSTGRHMTSAGYTVRNQILCPLITLPGAPVGGGAGFGNNYGGSWG